MELTKEQAREWIKCLVQQEVPVHPRFARELHIQAELPIPKHLVPRIEPISTEVNTRNQKFIKELENKLFSSMGIPEHLLSKKE